MAEINPPRYQCKHAAECQYRMEVISGDDGGATIKILCANLAVHTFELSKFQAVDLAHELARGKRV